MTLTIECDALFNGVEVRPASTIRIEGDRIVAIEPARAPLAGEGERLRCRFAMPGLIDSHVHISGYIEGNPSSKPFEAVKHFLRLMVYNGVTCVRDTGNYIETVRYARAWGEKYDGPRVFSSGPLLDTPPVRWAFTRMVHNDEDARREVDLLHREGVDFIKSYRSISVSTLRTIVVAAREHGLDVASDPAVCTIAEVARAGVRSIEHAANLLGPAAFPELPEKEFEGFVGRARLWNRIDGKPSVIDGLEQALRGAGTYLCPTLIVTRRRTSLDEMIAEPHLDEMSAVMPFHRHLKRMRGAIGMAIGRHFLNQYMPMEKPSRTQKAEMEAGLAKMAEVVARLHRAGVPLVVGTDAPNPSVVPGYSMHQEMALMRAGGLSPIEVLTAATSNAAALLRRKDLGRIAPGALADLVLLDADPIADIDATRSIAGVIRGGQQVDRKKVIGLVREAIET